MEYGPVLVCRRPFFFRRRLNLTMRLRHRYSFDILLNAYTRIGMNRPELNVVLRQSRERRLWLVLAGGGPVVAGFPITDAGRVEEPSCRAFGSKEGKYRRTP